MRGYTHFQIDRNWRPLSCYHVDKTKRVICQSRLLFLCNLTPSGQSLTNPRLIFLLKIFGGHCFRFNYCFTRTSIQARNWNPCCKKNCCVRYTLSCYLIFFFFFPFRLSLSHISPFSLQTIYALPLKIQMGNVGPAIDRSKSDLLNISFRYFFSFLFLDIYLLQSPSRYLTLTDSF